MTTTDTDKDAQAAPAAPGAQDGPNNAIAAGETVEVQGEEVAVEDEFDDASLDTPWTPASPAAPEGPESPEVSESPDEPAVKVDARQEALVRQLGELLPRPDAPADVLQAFVDRIMGHDRAGAELVLPQEPIEINREIDCQIYAHRTAMLAGSPNPRCYLTIAFDGVRHARLSGLLGANLKGSIRVNVIDLQAPLEAQDEEELPEAGVVRQAELPLQGRSPEAVLDRLAEDHREAYSVDNVGNVYRPHGFAPSPEDAAKCALCSLGEAHDLHAGKKRQAARTALRRRTESLIPHPYAATYANGDGPAAADTCVYCKLPEDDEIHARGEEAARTDEIPTFADRVAYYRDAQGVEEGIAWARAADDVEAGICAGPTESDELARKLLDDAGSREDLEAAAAENLGRPLSDEELTPEMRDARRRLADKSGD